MASKLRSYDVEVPPNVKVDANGEFAFGRSGGWLHIQSYADSDALAKQALKDLAQAISTAVDNQP